MEPNNDLFSYFSGKLTVDMEPRPFYLSDDWLSPYTAIIDRRIENCLSKEYHLAGEGTLVNFALGHHFYGLHCHKATWIFRENAPNATEIYLIGTFNNWEEQPEYRLQKINNNGDWEIILAAGKLKHEDLYKLSVHWDRGKGERIPSYANRVVQDEKTKIFTAQVWNPQKKYRWVIKDFQIPPTNPIIYEAHIGMATQEEKVGTYREFTENVLPVIINAGYNTIQLMAVQEHPFYGSFGYHVSNYFAASSRFRHS
jgi:1,4-alpha-glucan branching enzyme